MGFYWSKKYSPSASEYKMHRTFSLPPIRLPDWAVYVGFFWQATETRRALSWSAGRLWERTPHLAHASSQGARCELPKTFLTAGVTVNFTDEETKNSRGPVSCPSQIMYVQKWGEGWSHYTIEHLGTTVFIPRAVIYWASHKRPKRPGPFSNVPKLISGTSVELKGFDSIIF